ncbi:hypothetical protein AB0E08_49205, partial [Streptomyces sp. NPDC048281]|uniref:hypothetical protein n=1 Tax=Streptomyces sp. NPDC048281 TaxID=3154715 RepID=UPI00344457C7
MITGEEVRQERAKRSTADTGDLFMEVAQAIRVWRSCCGCLMILIVACCCSAVLSGIFVPAVRL